MGKLNDHFRNAAPSEIVSPLVKGQVMRNVFLRASFMQVLVVIKRKKIFSESLDPYLNDLFSFPTQRRQR